MTRWHTVVALGAAWMASAGAHAAATQAWDFRVFLDEAPIGHHRFAVRESGHARDVTSEARFAVKVLGFTAYRYAHDAAEHWRGGCLTSLRARTDDNGERTEVHASRGAERLTVSGPRAREPLPGCVLTFAYWDPAILAQTRLLNPQTGEHESVSVTRLGEETISVRGVPVQTLRYRITGPRHPVDLWYSPQRAWLQLESTVEGGRRLRYRLQ